jgi:hypothetical protein
MNSAVIVGILLRHTNNDARSGKYQNNYNGYITLFFLGTVSTVWIKYIKTLLEVTSVSTLTIRSPSDITITRTMTVLVVTNRYQHPQQFQKLPTDGRCSRADHASLEVFIAAEMKNSVFWDVMLHCWISGLCCFKRMLGLTYPGMQCCIPEDWNPPR